MQTRGLHALLERHPIAGGEARSMFVTFSALVGGAFLAGGWMAAIGALAVVRVSQSLLRGAPWRGSGGGGGAGFA
ncbi:MAG: hypothetical protein AB7T37_02110 [Dehalococcoidia bacterium]